MKKVKVLVVDDSALVRDILSRGLTMDHQIEVVGVASNPYMARDKIVQLKPDVLTLDVEMPKMDGVEFLQRLMPQYPLPVVMVSALTQKGAKVTLDALGAGAIDFVTKPSTDIARGLNGMLTELRQKVKVAATANLEAWKENIKEKNVCQASRKISAAPLEKSTDQVIAIGASTGGTEAIRRVITALPAATPGVVIVQHMPAGFTKHFADSLNKLAEMEVREAKTNDRVMPGVILIAPGDKHMTLRRSGGRYVVDCLPGEKVNGHCPSVDVLFHSVAQHAGKNAVGVILTGMGCDGAKGLLAMRQVGARTLAQDAQSSIVFGMPKAAYECSATEKVVALQNMAQAILNLVR